MTDEAYPFGLNVFAVGELVSSLDYSQAVNRIMHLFEVLWPEVQSQQYLPLYLPKAIQVFLYNPGKTLVDLLAFFKEDAFRAAMLQNVPDQSLRQFWATEYDNHPAKEREGRMRPLTNRLHTLFTGRPLIRNILGQRHNTINFRKAIEHREIIFIPLPLKTAEEDARLIGTLLVAQIHAAIFSFGNVPLEQRPGGSVYVDEFSHFATPDFNELFSEGRKFGVRLTIAHQYRSQLPSYLREVTLTARTKICFQVKPDDARELAHEFPAPEQGVKPEDVEPHPTDELLNHTHLYPPVVQEFIEAYLRPVQLQQVGAHGNQIELRDLGVNGMDLALGLLNGGRLHSVKVDEPVAYLDYVLQQVMVTGDFTVPIPATAVIGFANCGHSFFQAVRSMQKDDKRLYADIPALHIPAYLVVPSTTGELYWTRLPEDGREQLLHFFFHLRMTMRYLAKNPMGKVTTTSSADVGKMLNQLPRRAAFVRSGDIVGVIYTDTTPTPVSQREFDDRFQGIQFLTRQQYCHPRAEVEQALLGTPAPSPASSNSEPPAKNDQAPPLPADQPVPPPVKRYEEI